MDAAGSTVTFKEDEAQALADFLLPMLRWNHEERASAQEMLKHPWLKMKDNYARAAF